MQPIWRPTPARAVVLLLYASEQAQRVGMVRDAVVATINAGTTLRGLGEDEKAAACFDVAESVARQIGWSGLLGISRTPLGAFLQCARPAGRGPSTAGGGALGADAHAAGRDRAKSLQRTGPRSTETGPPFRGRGADDRSDPHAARHRRGRQPGRVADRSLDHPVGRQPLARRAGGDRRGAAPALGPWPGRAGGEPAPGAGGDSPAPRVARAARHG